MKIKLHNYGFICFLTVSSSIEACDINYTILDMNAKALASQICRGSVICGKDIEKNLDFSIPTTKPLSSETSDFDKLMNDTKFNTCTTRRKFGHNRLGTFISESKTLYETTTAPTVKYAVFTLCQSVVSEIIKMVELYKDGVEEESIIPDEQLSFFVNTAHSTPNLSDDEGQVARSASTRSSKSENLEREDKDDPTLHAVMADNTLSVIDLWGSAFSKRSLNYYPKQLERVKHPIRISCNLQYVRMDQIDELRHAVRSIDADDRRPPLREVIFMNGSSKKFNVLFPLLKELSATHKLSGKPITIVYSTTSDSQKAYKKLYTLGEAHSTLPKTIVIGEDIAIAEIRKKSVLDPQIIETDFSDTTLAPLSRLLDTPDVR